MTEQFIYVVYLKGPRGEGFPYGVFTTMDAAQQAREAIIKELDSKKRDVLDDEHQDIAHQLAGTLDEQVSIRECQVRSVFDEADIDDLFEDVEGEDHA